MAKLDELPEICPDSLDSWRDWLAANHASSPGVWLVFFRKSSAKQSLSYSDAVDEALCWGWIDSKLQSLDEQRYRQVYSPRKPRSVWSAINKRKIEALKSNDRMREPGLAAISAARRNGSWAALDGVEARELPADLQAAFARDPEVAARFRALAPSRQKNILQWLLGAKRPTTRDGRIAKILATLPEGKLPGPLAPQN